MLQNRYPTRWQPTRLNAKQRLHALLRENPELDPQELARQVGCTLACARIWKGTFFAKTYALDLEETPAQASRQALVSTD
ncbi:hypothetical protein KDW_46030 [Dictyobacter vulcani]|uniref:Uncharacterized protein n=1 Tax=Dictyobacter vulcani TaxID=2607529 RepID=A0A5J4KVG0_9CHLR|nr:hypothetical protein [Dictyobacter vulcani]GER90441.1 hypothetical protein KDW_46030 [Dictyobacter vulcani]